MVYGQSQNYSIVTRQQTVSLLVYLIFLLKCDYYKLGQTRAEPQLIQGLVDFSCCTIPPDDIMGQLRLGQSLINFAARDELGTTSFETFLRGTNSLGILGF